MTTAAARPSLIKVIAGAGLLVGTLDILDAIIFYGLRGVPATRILQGIAFGLIGRVSYTLGMRSVALGLLLHFFIATTWTTIYLLASRRLPLGRHPWIFGTIYGVLIYVIMNYVVLPLSHVGLRPLPPLIPLINGIGALIVCIGLPLALIARRYVSQYSA
jgi:hypothetical protein